MSRRVTSRDLLAVCPTRGGAGRCVDMSMAAFSVLDQASAPARTRERWAMWSARYSASAPTPSRKLDERRCIVRPRRGPGLGGRLDRYGEAGAADVVVHRRAEPDGVLLGGVDQACQVGGEAENGAVDLR